MNASRAKLGIGVLACMGIGWSVARYSALRDDAHRDTSKALGAELQQVKSRLARVEEERGRRELLARLPALAAPAASAASTALQAAPAPASSNDGQTAEEEEEALTERAQRQIDRQVEVLRSQLASETRDASWANDFEAGVRDRMRALDGKLFATTRLVSADCRTSLCMMEMVADSPEEARRLPKIMALIGLRTFVRSEPNPVTGGQRWTLFVERPGFPLPQADQTAL